MFYSHVGFDLATLDILPDALVTKRGSVKQERPCIVYAYQKVTLRHRNFHCIVFYKDVIYCRLMYNISKKYACMKGLWIEKLYHHENAIRKR